MKAATLSPVDLRALAIAQEHGVLRARDLTEHGIARVYLQRLQDQGLLVALGGGLYQPADVELTEYQSLIEVTRRVPSGVVCLLSALRFHDLTTQQPREVWLAIESQARTPKFAYAPLHIVHFSGNSWSEGVGKHKITIGEATIAARVTNPAKTVADCWKFRNKIGLDIALEALRDGWKQRKFTFDELWYYAQINRVANVMRPYLESVTFS